MNQAKMIIGLELILIFKNIYVKFMIVNFFICLISNFYFIIIF